MRKTFFGLLKEAMLRDKSIFLVVADMGLGLVEPFAEQFGDRFINVGIAEQNMIGIGAGLCNAGFRPVCYTLSNFLVERSFEQIRNDICLHDYPVTLVGTSTGFDNGKLGPSHQVIDDIGCMKILPNMHIYSPSSVSSTVHVFNEVMKNQSPAYVRIGSGSFDTVLPCEDVNQMVIKGQNPDVLVISHGTVLERCIEAVGDDPRFSVYCMNRIKPLEMDVLGDLLSAWSKVVVVEDHFGTSGLYDSLCRFLVESNIRDTKLVSIAPPELYEPVVGDRDFFADRYGYTPDKINRRLAEILV
jgi:transketolase